MERRFFFQKLNQNFKFSKLIFLLQLKLRPGEVYDPKVRVN